MSKETKHNLNSEPDMLAVIENRIRQAQHAKQHTRSLRNAKLLYPAKPADIPYNTQLYQHLDTAKNSITTYSRDLQIAENSLAKVPLLGKVVQAIQRQLHQIALFYTNRAMRHQLEINEHLLESLGQLTLENQKQQRIIAELQEQLK